MPKNRYQLPAAPSPRDWEAIAACLQDDGLAVVPSHAGYAVLCLAARPVAWQRMKALNLGSAALALPDAERFERIVQPKGNPLLSAVLRAMQRRDLTVELPRGTDSSLVTLRLLHKSSPMRALIEHLAAPVMALWLSGDAAGNLHEALQRLGSRVDLAVDHPLRPVPAEAPTIRVMRAGVAFLSGGPDEELRHQLSRSIHFVCLGNLNRSVFAEARLAAIMREEAIASAAQGWHYHPFWEVSSSGMVAVPGCHATVEMVGAAISFGAQELMKDHRSTRFHPEKAKDFDLLVGMDGAIIEDIRSFGLGDKIPLGLRKAKVIDPMGGPLQDYIAAANQIEELLEGHILARAAR